VRQRKKGISSLHEKAEDGDIAQRLTACLAGTKLWVQSQHSRKKKGKRWWSASTILKNEVRELILPNFRLAIYTNKKCGVSESIEGRS
jgi:hypothetical protein